MTTNFPLSLQDLNITRGGANDTMGSNGKDHSLHHQIEDDTITSLQQKLGVNNSTDKSSIDYMLKGKPEISQTTTSFLAGVKNPKFAGSGTISASGWINAENYGRYLYKTTTATTATYLNGGGINVLFTAIGASTNVAYLDITDNQVPANLSLSPKFINLEVGAKYRFAIEYDTKGNSGGALKALIQEQNGDGTNVDNYLNLELSTDRKTSYIEFTASKKYGRIAVGYFGGTVPSDGSILNVYQINLQKIIETQTNTLNSNQQSITFLKAVSSIDSIDVSNTAIASSVVNFGGDGTTITQKIGQRFTPTKNYISGLTFKKLENAGTPTGDMTISIQTNASSAPSGTVIASALISSTAWNNIAYNTYYYIDLPCILTGGTSYWIVFESSVNSASNYRKLPIASNAYGTTGDLVLYNGSAWSSTGVSGRDINFKIHFVKRTTGFNVSQNNQKINIMTDEDGFLDGSMIDLENNLYVYNSGYNQTQNSLVKISKNFYTATAGGGSSQSVINGLNTDGPLLGYYSNNASTATIKVNLPVNGTSISIDWQTYKWAAGNRNLKISFDDVTYTVIDTHNLANKTQRTTATYDITGKKIIYIQFDNPGSNNFTFYSIKALLDTSSIALLYNKPTNTDIYQTYIKTLSFATTTLTYRANKYGFPAFEFGNGEYMFLDTDTLNANYVKLSTDNINYTTVLDGGSITINSTSLPIIYAIYNIPMNRIYVNSNDLNSSNIKSGSLQGNLGYITKNQGLKYDIEDLWQKINDISNAIKVLQSK